MWRYDHVEHYEVSDDLGDHDYEHYGVSAPDDDLGDHDPFPYYDLGDHDPFPHHHDLPAHDLPALNRWVPARGTLSMRFRPTIHTRAGRSFPRRFVWCGLPRPTECRAMERQHPNLGHSKNIE
jgi:hypothetical protein